MNWNYNWFCLPKITETAVKHTFDINGANNHPWRNYHNFIVSCKYFIQDLGKDDAHSISMKFQSWRTCIIDSHIRHCATENRNIIDCFACRKLIVKLFFFKVDHVVISAVYKNSRSWNRRRLFNNLTFYYYFRPQKPDQILFFI